MYPSLPLLERYAPLTPLSECPEMVAHQAADLFALWQAWESECGATRDVPYWAIVWPAARVLARYLSENPSVVKERSVLDCGCGGGMAAITAARKGAGRATGCDLDPTAAVIAERNAVANAVTIDFLRQDVIACCDPQRFDLILVADLFYQREISAGVLAALKKAHDHGCEVIIADSGRPFLPKADLTEIHAQSVATSFDVEGCRSRTVRLFRFTG